MDLLSNGGTITKVTSGSNQFSAYLADKIPDLITFGVQVLLALVFFFIGCKIIKWIRTMTRNSIRRSKADKGVEQFVDSLLKFSLFTILLFMIATKFGVESSSVAALIASGGVAIGLALQGSLSNFAGGVLILLLKPFVVGDYIVEDTYKNEGTVKEIQIFYTKLSTEDNKTIVIPNGTLANTSMTNVTAKDCRRLDLSVDISYKADLKKAKRLIEELLHENKGVIKGEAIQVFVAQLTNNAVVIGSRAWVKTEEYWVTRWKLLEDIKLKLDEENIEIACPHMTVMVDKQDELS